MYHAWKIRNTYKILVRKSEEKRTRGRPRNRWKDNIRIYRRGIGYGSFGLDASGSG
jgi:hypothetical protein